jgi:hypothetical protein
MGEVAMEKKTVALSENLVAIKVKLLFDYRFVMF